MSPRRRRPDERGTIYLLHFDRPYQHARHYLGFTTQAIEERVREHMSGTGARLLSVVINAGISIELARTWAGSRSLERRLKNHGGATRICPICSPATTRGQLTDPPAPPKGIPASPTHPSREIQCPT